MLRVLMAFVLLLPTLVFGEFVNPTSGEIKEQQEVINKALDDVESTQRTKIFLEEINTNKRRLEAAVIEPSNNYYQIPKEYHTDDLPNMASILGQKGDLGSNHQMHGITVPIVLISFSMPSEKIAELIAESDRTGALIVVQGLIDDDMMKTIKVMSDYAKGHESGGIILDPTLFDRFKVTSVPTFILPLEPVQGCDPTGCKVPDHVIAKGNSSLHYFLDLVARTGSDFEKEKARMWLAKYGESK